MGLVEANSASINCECYLRQPVPHLCLREPNAGYAHAVVVLPAETRLAAMAEHRIGGFIGSRRANALERWRRGSRCNPLRQGVRHAFFRVGSWSIDGDTGSGRGSFDLLYGGSDADEIEEGGPKFDIEVTVVGFVFEGDRIRFVYGEDV
jgi:hypothetical protein